MEQTLEMCLHAKKNNNCVSLLHITRSFPPIHFSIGNDLNWVAAKNDIAFDNASTHFIYPSKYVIFFEA